MRTKTTTPCFGKASLPALAALAAFALAAHPAAAQTTFQFQFDDFPDGAVTAPFVGTGTLVAANNPGNGTFAFSALGPTTMAFSFGSDTFTDADIQTDLSTVEVVLSPIPGGQDLQFTNTPAGAKGPLNGSLDLINGSGDVLSFEPDYVGGDTLYFQAGSQLHFGDYQGLSVAPEPSPVADCGIVALFAAGLMLKARKRKADVSRAA